MGTGGWGCLCAVTTGADHGEGSRPLGRLYLSINIIHPIPQGRGGAKKPTLPELHSFYCLGMGRPQAHPSPPHRQAFPP